MLTLYNRDDIALVSERFIDHVLVIDAQILAKEADRAKFVTANKTEYTLAINTWLHTVRSYSRICWSVLKNRIEDHGLVSVIRECDQVAQFWISTEFSEFPEIPGIELWIQLYKDIQHGAVEEPLEKWRSKYNYEEPRPDFMSKDWYWGPERTLMHILRYLKRLSPSFATKLNEDTLAAFYNEQRRLKGLDRGCFGIDNRLILDLVRDEMSKLPLKKRIREFSKLEVYDLDFTPGLAADAKASLASKLAAVYKVAPYYFNNMEHFESIYKPIYMGYTSSHVQLVAVPKNVKTARTIAMETTYRQATAKSMFNIIDRYQVKEINLHDQSRNQELAYLGSLDGSWATIDLKSASDDVRYSLIRELYPQEYVEYLDMVRPTTVKCAGRPDFNLISWATMGNSLTFVLECEVFRAIAMAALRFHNRYFEPVPLQVSVYGDDIIVPNSACSTVVSFLENLGFLVNTEKTFDSGYYRESCGVEFYKGQPMHGIYFPRHPISNDLTKAFRDSRTNEWYTTYTQVVELQHRLYEVSYEAAMYVAAWLKEQVGNNYCSLPQFSKANVAWDLNTRIAREVKLSQYACVEWHDLIDGYIPMDITGLVEIPSASKARNPELDTARTRRYVTVPVVSYNSLQDSELFESYLYLQFLKHGPRYLDDTLRGVGVSAKPVRQDTLHPNFRWGNQEVI